MQRVLSAGGAEERGRSGDVAAGGIAVRSGPMVEDDPEIEYSPLCGDVSRKGITVRVEIYRLAEGSEGWSLEVIDQEGASTVSDDLFATDREAYAEFYRTPQTEGIRSFAERPGRAQ